MLSDSIDFFDPRGCETDAQPSRSSLHAGKGLKIAVTDGAKQRLLALQQEQVAALEVSEESAASIEIARISKDEMGVRPLPVIGEYGKVTPLVSHPMQIL